MRRLDDALLERRQELHALDARLAAAAAGDGCIVAVEGPPGIGKSRLVEATADLAADHGLAALIARGSPLEETLPYGVVRQLFEHALRQADTEAAFAGAAGPAQALFDPSAAGTAGDRFGLDILHALLWLVINLCDSQPLLLAVDDAHWADLPSLRFLSYLGRRLDGLPAMILIAQRDGYVESDELGDVLARGRRPLRLRPQALTELGAVELLKEALGPGLDDKFCRACHRGTSGNPLLLRELARALAPYGESADASTLARLGPPAIAQTVRRRLADSTADARLLAEAAAHLEEQTPLALAATLAGVDDSDADEALLELRRLEILMPGPGSGIAFVHPLVRDVLAATAKPARSSQLHADAARLLAEAGAPDEVVATHLVRAPATNDPEAGATLRRAASIVRRAGDPVAAAGYLLRALDEQLSTSDHVETLVELGFTEGDFDHTRAAAHLREALPLVEDPLARARVAARLASLMQVRLPEEAIQLGLDTVEALNGSQPELRKELLAVVGLSALLGSADAPQLVERITGRLRLESDGAGPGARMAACVLSYHDTWRGVPAAESLAQLEPAFAGEWLATAARQGGVFALGMVTLVAADSPVASRAVDEWLDAARRRGLVAHVGGALMWRATLQLAHGELAEAVASGEDALEAYAAFGTRHSVSSFLTVGTIANAHLELGDVASATEILGRLSYTDAELGAIGLHGLLPARARLRAAGGETDAALRETLEIGRRIEQRGGATPALVPWRSDAALLLAHAGEIGRARELAVEEVGLARAWGGARALGRALTAAATVAEPADGFPHADEAMEVLADIRAPLELARAHGAAGLALTRLGRDDAARSAYGRGLEIAASCSAQPLERELRARLVAAGGRPRRAAQAGPQSLTSGERRIAQLAAAGNSNRAIAEQLYLTPRTVEFHLTNAYRKLGIRSRGQLAEAL